MSGLAKLSSAGRGHGLCRSTLDVGKRVSSPPVFSGLCLTQSAQTADHARCPCPSSPVELRAFLLTWSEERRSKKKFIYQLHFTNAENIFLQSALVGFHAGLDMANNSLICAKLRKPPLLEPDQQGEVPSLVPFSLWLRLVGGAGWDLEGTRHPSGHGVPFDPHVVQHYDPPRRRHDANFLKSLALCSPGLCQANSGRSLALP